MGKNQDTNPGAPGIPMKAMVTLLPPTTQNARARFFNGAGTPAMVQVKANPKKDGSGTEAALVAAIVEKDGGHVEGLANQTDYERFDVTVTVGGTAHPKAYTIDDATGATKLSDIQLFRQAGGTTVAVLRYSTTASPYQTTGVVVLAFP